MDQIASLMLRRRDFEAHSRQPARHRIASLEIARFLAALSVILWHYRHLLVAATPTAGGDPPIDVDRLPLDALLAPFYHIGYAAVYVFWTISGFIFFFKYAEPIARRTIGPGKFFLLRFSRLYPLHVATLILVLALQNVYLQGHPAAFIYGSNDAAHFVAQVFMASNWFVDQPITFNGPMWSVSAEVVVYLLFFVIVRGTQPGLRLPIAAMFLFLAIDNLPAFAIVRPVARCAEYFFLGGVIEAVQRRVVPTGALAKNLVCALSLCVAGGCVYVNSLLGWPVFARGWAFAFCASFIVACVNSDRIVGPRTLMACAALGELTYSMYLLHFPIQIVMATVVDRAGWSRDWFYQLTPFLLYVSAVGIASWLSYHLFELPAQEAIRRRFVAGYAERPALPGATVAEPN
jgi:peptidoglycan/LPS O-acetylase OafA/YrhL